jgi:hypothetical protein
MSEDPRALSRVDPFSGVPPDRSRAVVPLLDLFAASVPRADIASARIPVLTFYNASVRVDGKFGTSHSGR